MCSWNFRVDVILAGNRSLMKDYIVGVGFGHCDEVGSNSGHKLNSLLFIKLLLRH